MKPNNPLQALKAIGRYAGIPWYRILKGKPSGFFFGFSPWKTFLQEWFPDIEVKRTDREVSKFVFYTQWAPWILRNKNSTIYVWGFKSPPHVDRFARRFNVPLMRVEDGFVRSVKLGAQKAPPASITVDSRTLYFDATQTSDLEHLLQTHDFDGNPELMTRARGCIDLLLQQRLSKYNLADPVDISAIYGPKNRKRILVLGQVEDDASISYGCIRSVDNNQLVLLARYENPDAQIIYKPHPEILYGTRQAASNPAAVAGIAQVLVEDVPLADAFETVDHVYTITSLAGFEALLRGIKVTTIGCPFYSGWGLTDDRQPNKRRTRKLTVEQVFAASYLLYARYVDPIAGGPASLETVLAALALMKKAAGNLPNNDPQPATLDALIRHVISEELARLVKSNADRSAYLED